MTLHNIIHEQKTVHIILQSDFPDDPVIKSTKQPKVTRYMK